MVRLLSIYQLHTLHYELERKDDFKSCFPIPRVFLEANRPLNIYIAI